MADVRNVNESWIGRSVPRSEVGRLVTGRGRYTDDIAVADLGHVAFLRSPHAHARIESIDVAAAKDAPGVIAVVSADDLAPVCKPWQTRLALIKNHVSPPQSPLASKEACWQGEAIAAVVIGGGSLTGGEGSVLGTLIGAFVMGLLSNGSDLLGISPYWQQAIIGGVIIAAVGFDELRKRRMAT